MDDRTLREFWWQMTQARPVLPHREGKRDCGCYADPVVFGHFHQNGCRMEVTR